MHITKIELEDIKSHREATYNFERGTTAITGENGAGKTTLIEAVAWTLFDLLDYKKDDFVRRGAKKGVARVTFESGLDGREYQVYRDTGTGYHIYDPQIKTRIADKKDEVSRFLWSHLGVEAGTDLEALFRRAIGVPQGTFTAIFLETGTERKKAFDKLLKVEEYRQGAEKLRETSRFIEQKITGVREKIARAEGELSRFETVEDEHKMHEIHRRQLSDNLETLNKEVEEKSASVGKYEAVELKVNQLKSVFDQLNTEKNRAEILLTQKENDLHQAKNADEKIKLVEADYQKHLDALGKLKELERERGEREKLDREKQQNENAQVKIKSDQKRFQENLEKSLQAYTQIETLQPQIAEQTELEKQREILRDRLAKSKAKDDLIKSLDDKITHLRESYKKNQAQIKDAETRTATAKNFEELNTRDKKITEEISQFRARLQHDQEFQATVKNGLCPILSQKCLNLKPGETLEGFLGSQFKELRTSIGTLEIEQRELADQLRFSREAEKIAHTLAALRSRENEIKEEGTRLRTEKESLEKDAGDFSLIQKDLGEIESKLQVLANPKAKIALLETEAKRETEIRDILRETDKNLERLENDRKITDEKLESYKDLDANWTEFSVRRDRTAQAHREFLTNETLGKLLPERADALEKAQAEIKILIGNLTQSENEFNEESKNYDREQHQTEKVHLADAQKRQTETNANLENSKKRLAQLAAELETMVEIRKQMQAEFFEKERLEKVAETTAFIRDTLKEAAPRVARNYVYHVSLEANQMFREISGNAERTLRWTEDYGIMLEENGYERPFSNLSGGEQMAAALSVRLALLKQLSDIRLAFFDEPTTNMDAARRERLAEQISHITEKQTFDQLFVISHDDTFEGYVDNVVSVGGNDN